MARKYISFILILLASSSLIIKAQSAGNDPDPTRWLTYSQTYYKFPIAQNGIYRITKVELEQAGFSVGRVDPTTIQLFHRGVEQAIFIAGEADNHLNSDDYLEFYGRGNDGVADSLLYRPYKAQPHTYYSLFNDTTTYFLTWRLDGKLGKRMATYTDTTYSNLTPEPYHWEEEVRLFTNDYPGWAAGISPKTEYSHYETGEGYTGVVQQKDKPYYTVFSLTDAVKTGPAPQVDVLLVGRDFINHRVDCLVGPAVDTHRLLDSVRFSTYDNAHIQQNVSWSDVGSGGRLVISTLSRGENTSVDPYSVSYIRLRYPQTFTATGQSQRTFRLGPNIAPTGENSRSLLTMSDVPNSTRFWDITNPNTPVQIGATIPIAGSARLIVHDTGTAKIIFSASQPKTVSIIRPVSFINWTNRKPTYLIISHEALMKSVGDTTNAVRSYAAYRASAMGGGHDTLTTTMQQLFDQYSYGERSPLAIRRFAAQMLRQNKETVQYLLLIGRARSTPGIRHDPNQATLDMVMTAGFPGSDIVFTTGLNGNPDGVPAIPTGRINAGTPQEVVNYLTKVKEYESQTVSELWRKNLLHLSGGQTPGEQDLFRRLVDSYGNQAITESLGARVTTISKETDKLVEQIDVAEPVNAGVGLITFFGHSGLDITDVDIGFCSNDARGYQNRGRYPLLLINGCAVGNFFFGQPTLATDWVLTPNRGAIGAIAHSHLGHPDVMHRYTTTFYNLLTDSTQLHKSIGHLQKETIRRMLAQTPDGQELANCQQMVLQGDPAIRLFPFKTPDYAITAGGLAIQSRNIQSRPLQGENQQPLTTLSDSVQIRVVVQNAGQYWAGKLPAQVRRLINGRESGTFNFTLPRTVAYQDTLTVTFPNERDAEGHNQFEVTINPIDSPIARTEINHTNNQAIVEITISGHKPVLIYPAQTSIIKTSTIRLTAQYFAEGTHLFDLELDSTAHFDSPFKRQQRITATNNISYPVTLSTRANNPIMYHWRVRLADKVNNPALDTLDSWSTGSFFYSPNSTTTGLPEGQLQLATPLPIDRKQGDIVAIPVEFMNLSPYPFTDSLVVQQTIYAAGFMNPQTTSWSIRAPSGTDTLRLTTHIVTEKLPGINRVILTVNPRIQPEYSFLNNTLDLLLPVKPDALGPVLEVAIDGARIVTGSVVSAQPVIDIVVADENRALIRRDTIGLDLYLQRPGKNAPFERLSWRSSIVQPTGTDNVFRLRYPSPKLTEGVYHLFVTARDVIGNPSVPYQVSFRVMNERKLTDLTVYPNPFRDQLLFSFHLTGDQAPIITVLTLTDITGRMVRHVTSSSRVGLNEWKWDGRNDAGNPLPAGIYLYKLTLLGADSIDWPIADKVTSQLSGRLVLIR
ncbi:putative type IX secretion system sortase PorU2 [Spirosoma flavum]|uniref:C25 family cysteine peptidase n=1 Tax=Spirosoma flavum TaxID=2048557 RepID=A0ABW6AD53_9BACT